MEEEEEEEEVAAEAGRRSLASKQQPEFQKTTPELGDPLTQTTPEDEVSASEGGKMKQRGATAVVEREKGVTGDHKKSHKAERKKSSKKSKSPRRTASIEPM